VFQPKSSAEIADDDVLGWVGGFDVLLGNPPWERIKIQEQEWFAHRRPDISAAPNAAERRRMIQRLADEDSALYKAFQDDRRVAEGESHIARDSGRFPCVAGATSIRTHSSPG
jgi:hypothetical protein